MTFKCKGKFRQCFLMPGIEKEKLSCHVFIVNQVIGKCVLSYDEVFSALQVYCRLHKVKINSHYQSFFLRFSGFYIRVIFRQFRTKHFRTL